MTGYTSAMLRCLTGPPYPLARKENATRATPYANRGPGWQSSASATCARARSTTHEYDEGAGADTVDCHLEVEALSLVASASGTATRA